MLYSAVEERINSAIRFFLCLLVFWLPYSPAVVESCVVIGLILWIVKRGWVTAATAGGGVLKYLKAFQPAHTSINTSIFFFLTVSFFSSATSAFWEYSLHNFLTKTLEWFIVYFLVSEVINTRRYIYIILWIFLFTSSATALDAIVQFYVTHKDLFLEHSIIAGDRPTAGFKTPNGLGGYLTLVIPAAFTAIFLKNQSPRYRLLMWGVWLCMLWSLILTASRGAWLGTVLGGALITLIFLFRRQRRKLYLSFALILTIFLLYMFFGFTLAGSLNADAARLHTVQWRMDIWRQSISMIRDAPWFGHGINTFMRLFEAYRRDIGGEPTYAHNCFIQLSVETGIMGLFGFLWIMVELFRKTIICLDRHWANDQALTWLSAGLLSGMMAFLTHSFFDTNFYSLQLSTGFWVMAGLLTAIHNLKENSWLNAGVPSSQGLPVRTVLI